MHCVLTVFHGSRCSNKCPTHCESCTNNTFCPSCEAGWAGETCECNLNCSDRCGIYGLCNLGCIDGLYGLSCGQQCKASDCTSCNQTTGNCTQCVAGKYGESCEKTCHSNCAMDECEIGGTCLQGCKAGFTGSTCFEGKNFLFSYLIFKVALAVSFAPLICGYFCFIRYQTSQNFPSWSNP